MTLETLHKIERWIRNWNSWSLSCDLLLEIHAGWTDLQSVECHPDDLILRVLETGDVIKIKDPQLSLLAELQKAVILID